MIFYFYTYIYVTILFIYKLFEMIVSLKMEEINSMINEYHDVENINYLKFHYMEKILVENKAHHNNNLKPKNNLLSDLINKTFDEITFFYHENDFLYTFPEYAWYCKKFIMDKKIIIVGAGVAGINAATKLVDNGYPGELITIIDKGNNAESVKVNGKNYGGGIPAKTNSTTGVKN